MLLGARFDVRERARTNDQKYAAQGPTHIHSTTRKRKNVRWMRGSRIRTEIHILIVLLTDNTAQHSAAQGTVAEQVMGYRFIWTVAYCWQQLFRHASHNFYAKIMTSAVFTAPPRRRHRHRLDRNVRHARHTTIPILLLPIAISEFIVWWCGFSLPLPAQKCADGKKKNDKIDLPSINDYMPSELWSMKKYSAPVRCSTMPRRESMQMFRKICIITIFIV